MNVRILILIVIVLGCILSAQAQLKLGVHLMSGTNTVLVSGTNASKSFTEKLGLAGTLGVSGNYYLGVRKRLLLCTGISLSYLSSRFEYPNSYASTLSRPPFDVSNVTANNAIVLISVPVSAGYSFGKFSMDAGLSFSYNAYQHSRFGWDETVLDYSREVREKTSLNSRNLFLLNSVTNLEYQISKRVGLLLNLNVGMTDYFKLQRPVLNPNYKSRLHSVLCGINYILTR
jgi:hypothetical protein